MSKQQQLELIATLRQGQLDLLADVATLRVAFTQFAATQRSLATSALA